MAVSGASGGGQVLSLDTLVRLRRGARDAAAPLRLPLPEGMTTPLGCDAVAAPARFGPLILPRLPRVGCVYADDAYWWWVVPSESDYALEWPTGVRYSPDAVVPDMPRLIHRPDGSVPYTPPIPLYLALCRVTGTTPTWLRQLSA
ncbi:hypothetical protein ACHBTE_25215 [Streptomyces sp. M41]|uniref:hypothetical protein n=1 Tax=Streptomyces sp. M41 TaxID=3059412 RepID=UPI00374DCE8E